jgi:hypothetical protein
VTEPIPRCPAAPPAHITETLQTVTLPVGSPWYRIHWHTRSALEFAITRTSNRFDPLAAPWSSSKVLYAASQLEVALSETVVRWRQLIGSHLVDTAVELAPRRVARLHTLRELTLIDATALGLAPIQRAVDAAPPYSGALADDIFNCSDAEYPLTQQWGAWCRTQSPHAAGIRWVSRQFNTGQCIVLFEDRCADALEQRGKSLPLIEDGSLEERTLDEMLAALIWART